MSRVLVIDDDEMQRTLLDRMLSSLGLDVETAADGREGLRFFQQNRPELVLTDISMPELDGHQVIAAIRAGDASVPIIAISGGGPAQDKDDLLIRAARLGAREIIVKPFEFEQIKGAVRRALSPG